MDEHESAMSEEGKKLRFNVGDRVSCKVNIEREWWLLGTVVKLLPQCENFSYKVRLEHEGEPRIHNIAEDEDSVIKMATKEFDLRFKVGDRVACNCGEWKHGTVVKLWWYVMEEGESHPYQVLLDDHEEPISAPYDLDSCIQEAIPEFDPKTASSIDAKDEDSIHDSNDVNLAKYEKALRKLGLDDETVEKDTKLFGDQHSKINLTKYAKTLRGFGLDDDEVAMFVSTDLRFEVGDRVQCNVGPERWDHGVVIKLWYQEFDDIYPYQLRLDDKRLIFAPIDCDSVIKVSDLPDPVGLYIEEGDPLFTDPVANEDDCPICLHPFPRGNNRKTIFQYCCGKEIYTGCSHAIFTVRDDDRCPFCRVPNETSEEEALSRLNKRIAIKDPLAAGVLSECYRHGLHGLLVDLEKAFELSKLAESLGSTKVYFDLGCAYYSGEGVDRDTDKAKHYFELAAMNGNSLARLNLANFEQNEGNPWKSYKHHTIAAKSGLDVAMLKVQAGYADGFISEEEFVSILRSFEKAQLENSSFNRKKAAQQKAYVRRIPKEYFG